LALRKCLPDDGMVFVDVTVTEHMAAEAFKVVRPRTYFNPTDNQAMGWSILGDTIYGSAPRFGGPGLHLLSREIVVPIYKNRDPVRVTAPVPPQMRVALLACGWSGEEKAA